LVPQKNENLPNDSLQLLRQPYADWITAFSGWSNAKVDESVSTFRDWLRKPATTGPTVILVLSHHDANRLYFDPQDTLEVPSVIRKFEAPSLVILDACGTGKPGATEFVTTFNRKGVSAAIATSLEVDASMGGEFAALFTKALTSTAGMTVSQAEFDAMNKLRDMKSPATQTKYGPRALIFMIAGNGDLRVCTPPVP
jgi:hypothetical protein